MDARGPVTGPNAEAPERAAEHFRMLADVMAQYPHFKSPAKSRASREAEDDTFDGEWGRPTFELLHDAAPRLAVVSDHLRALAAVTDAPEIVLAIATLARPALEALGALWWLYDPALDVRERVRRRMNLRLASLVEQWNLAESLGEAARDRYDLQIDEIEATAAAQGFDVTRAKSRFEHVHGDVYLDKRLPSDATLITGVVESGSPQGLGRLVHRVTSAVIHGQAHALLPFIVEHRDGRDPGVALAQIGMTLQWYAILTGPVAVASNATMLRLIEHFGWSRGRWDRVAQPAVLDWRVWLRAE